MSETTIEDMDGKQRKQEEEEEGESSQEESSAVSKTLPLHLRDSSNSTGDCSTSQVLVDMPHRSLATAEKGEQGNASHVKEEVVRADLQQQLDDLLDEQINDMHEELQKQMDKEIRDALQKQIDDALQRQIDEALDREMNRALEEYNQEMENLLLTDQLGDDLKRASINEEESPLVRVPTLNDYLSVASANTCERIQPSTK